MDASANQPWWAAALIAAIVALAGVVVFLFRRSDKRDRHHEAATKEHVEEQAAKDIKLEALRAEYEAKFAELAEKYAEELATERDASRDREDMIRREFAEMMEAVEAEASKTFEALHALLTKIYERFIGPRRGY